MMQSEVKIPPVPFYFCSITPDLLQHRDELSKFIGDEISRTMVEQRNLEKRYEELIEQRAAMKGMVNKNKYKEVQEEIQDVSRSLRESTNNLVRSLKENPNVSGITLLECNTVNDFNEETSVWCNEHSEINLMTPLLRKFDKSSTGSH